MSSLGTNVSVGRRLPFFTMSSSWPLPPFVASMSRIPSTWIVLSKGGAAEAAAAAGLAAASCGDADGCSAGAGRDFFSIRDEGNARPRLTLKTQGGISAASFERP